jgi:hypothetical protein
LGTTPWTDRSPKLITDEAERPMGDERTRQAGEGLSDEEMARQVAGQTSSDLDHADVFQREADGTTTDTEAAKASADELAGD